MPSTSKKQHNFMAAIAHNPSFAKKVGVPQSVGKDFNNADKGKTFKQGGETMATKKMNPFAKMEKSGKDVGMKRMRASPKRNMMMEDSASPAMPMMKKGGMAKTKKMASGGSASKRADGVAQKGKTKGKMLNKGGMTC
jgi:hypothetical protein